MSGSNSRIIARLAVRNAAWVSIGSYLNILIGFVSNLVLTRILNPEIFGTFTLATFWSNLLNIRSLLGLDYAAIQRKETDSRLLGAYFALNLGAAGLSLFLGLIAIVVLPLFNYSQAVIWTIAGLVVIESLVALGSPFSLILEKELQLSRPMLLALSASVVAYIVGIWLAISGYGLLSLIVIVAITRFISVSGLYWICKNRSPDLFKLHWQFDLNLAKRLLRVGIPTGLSFLARMMSGQFDTFLIGTFVGYSILGLYDRAFRIAHWSNLLLVSIMTRVAFITFAKVQDDVPRLTHAVRLFLWMLLTLGLPVTLTIFFGANEVVYILYGPKWSGSAFFLRFLVVYALAAPFVELSIWLSVSQGDTRTTMLITTTLALTIVLVGLPLTWYFGVLGTLIADGITELVGLCLSSYYVFHKLPLHWGQTFGPSLIAASLASVVLLTLSYLPGRETFLPVLRLVVIGSVGSSTFFLSLFAMRPQETITNLHYLYQVWRGSSVATNL